jgi:hypothetical protein
MTETLDCNDILIENLGMSEKCVERWKRVAVSNVGDILHVFENFKAGILVNIRLGGCLDETIERLKAIGCLPDHLTFDE